MSCDLLDKEEKFAKELLKKYNKIAKKTENN